VQGGDQRLELDRAEELDLVEQEYDPALMLPSGLPESHEQIGQVIAQAPAVRQPLQGVDIEAGAHGPIGCDGDLKGLQHPGRSLGSIPPALSRRDLEQDPTSELAHARSELEVLCDLDFGRYPGASASAPLEVVQENGLADSAQTRDQHRLLGMASAHAVEQDLERVHLGLAAHQSRRASAGVGRVRVVLGAHLDDLSMV
jgi:hypothetical protein